KSWLKFIQYTKQNSVDITYDGSLSYVFFFFFQAEDGIRDRNVTGVQTCALPISISQWRFTCPRRCDFTHIRKFKWQILFRYCTHCTIFPMYNWNRFSPVPLTRKEPVS